MAFEDDLLAALRAVAEEDPFRDLETGEYPFAYRCELCNAVIEVDDVGTHTEEERAKDTWPGHIGYTRVDKPVKGSE